MRRARERDQKAHVIDRLQQIVERLHFKGCQCIFVIRRQKNDAGDRSLGQRSQYFNAAHARHLDIQKHQVRLQCQNGTDGIFAVRALPDDGHVRMLR
jgi:hypothetical protein